MNKKETLTQHLWGLPWLPRFSVRQSSRAKYLHISFTKQNELEIVMPNRTLTIKDILAFVCSRKLWILTNYHNMSKAKVEVPSLPHQLQLKTVDEVWNIIYITHQGRTKLKADLNNKIILIYSNTFTQIDIKKLLIFWLKKHSQPILKKRLNAQAKEMGINFSCLNIRAQKTIWGSCNSKGNISLNCKIIFLPSILTNYLIVHELSHITHLDHSARFWQLVAKYVRDLDQIKMDLKRSEQYVPKIFL